MTKRWARWLAAALLGAVAAGCGAASFSSGGGGGNAMPGLWLEEREAMEVYYWLKPDGTGERLRRSRPAGAWKEPVTTSFAWKLSGTALTLSAPDEAFGRYELQAPESGGVLSLSGPDGATVTWYGCGSGKLPNEFAGLCTR